MKNSEISKIRPVKGLRSFARNVMIKVLEANGPVSYADIADDIADEYLEKLDLELSLARSASLLSSQKEEKNLLHQPSSVCPPQLSLTPSDDSSEHNVLDICRIDGTPALLPATENVDSGLRHGPKSLHPGNGFMMSKESRQNLAQVSCSYRDTRSTSRRAQNSHPSATHSADPEYDAAYERKNIHRRVYDVLNVMVALGCCADVGWKRVKWSGLEGLIQTSRVPDPTSSAHPNRNLRRASAQESRRKGFKKQADFSAEKHSLQSKIFAQRVANMALKSRLAELQSQVESMTTLLGRNIMLDKNGIVSNGVHYDCINPFSEQADSGETTQLPFALLATGKVVNVRYECEKERSVVKLRTDGPFSIIDGCDIVTRICPGQKSHSTAPALTSADASASIIEQDLRDAGHISAYHRSELPEPHRDDHGSLAREGDSYSDTTAVGNGYAAESRVEFDEPREVAETCSGFHEPNHSASDLHFPTSTDKIGLSSRQDADLNLEPMPVDESLYPPTVRDIEEYLAEVEHVMASAAFYQEDKTMHDEQDNDCVEKFLQL